MANLKELKNRIKSVKSTQKITKAMKMVAASKLKRAQERAESARPYTEKMERMLITLATKIAVENAPALLTGRRDASGNIKDKTHLLIVAASDRGLCGAFNSSIVRQTRLHIETLENQGKRVRIMTIGRKAYDQLRYGYKEYIVHKIDTSKNKQPEFANAEEISSKIISMFEAEEIDSCSLVYNKFISALTQKVTFQQLVPLDIRALKEDTKKEESQSSYEYEPGEEEVLSFLLPRNISVQIFHGLLENSASEQGARMTAMENATRNAGEMIKDLTLIYNRSRQAAITTELTEIISGAEAL